MDEGKKAAGLGSLAGVAALVAIAALVGFVVVYTGGYNIAATEEHTSFVRWAFDTTFRNSIKSRAADFSPQNLSHPK